MIILISFLIICSYAAQLIMKPPKLNLETVIIQIGDGRQFFYPRQQLLQLQEVYRRQVMNANPNDTTMQRICKQIPPTVNFEHQSTLMMSSDRYYPEIVTDFKDLLYRRQIIDAIIYQNELFVLFQNGSLNVVVLKQQGFVFDRGMTILNTQISEGQLFILSNKMMIIANSVLYYVNDNNEIVEVKGDTLSQKFSMVEAFNNSHFAVAQLNQGVGIYYFNNYQIVLKGVFGKEFFKKQSIFVVDLAFDGSNILYVLDEKGGLLSMNIFSFLINGTMQLAQTKLQKSNCDNLLFTKGDIYMVCGDIFKYSVEGDQSVEQLPKPLFKVKQMVAHKNTIVLLGDNLFKFYWYGRYIQLFQFTGASKILFSQNRYIAIKNTAIMTGTYSFTSPTLYCQSDDLIKEQAMEVVFKTSALCSRPYIKYVGDDQVPQPGDTCIYVVPAMINFWKADLLSIEPVIVGLITIGVLVILSLFWSCILICKQKKLAGVLQYLQVSTGQTGYNVMVQQGGVPSVGSSQVRQSNELDFQSKIASSQKQPYNTAQQNEPSHDIGQ